MGLQGKNKAMSIRVGCTLVWVMASLCSGFAFAAADDSQPQEGEYGLPPVTVEAPRPDWEQRLSPGSVSVIVPEETQGEHKRLPELLETVPGVHIRRMNGTGQYSVAYIRGSTAAEVGVYMDGVPLKLGSEAAVDLSVIPVENVARIEVYRGYIPARFAGAPLGGVINIVTKKPETTGGMVSTGMRSFGGYQNSVSINSPLGSGSLLIGINRDQAKGDFPYNNLETISEQNSNKDYYPPVERRRLNNSYHNTDVLLKWQDAQWHIKGTWRESTNLFPTPLFNSDEDDNPASPWFSNFRKEQTNIQKTLTVGRRLTIGKLDWGWQVDYLDQNKSWDTYPPPSGSQAIAQTNGNYQTRRTGMALDGTYQLADRHLLEFHGDYAHETYDVVGNGWSASGFFRGHFAPHYTSDQWHLQLQDTITLGKEEDLWFTPVVRMDQVKGRGNTEDEESWRSSWGTALKKKLANGWTLRSTYGTYNRFPNFYEIYGDGFFIRPNPTVIKQPLPTWEHGTQWDIGTDWQGKLGKVEGDLSLTYFHRRTEDLIDLIRLVNGSVYRNGGAGKAHGVELDSKLAWGRWDLQLAATWTWSEYLEAYYQQKGRLGKPFYNIPEFESYVRLGYRFPGEKLSIFTAYHYQDEVPFSHSNSSSFYEDSLGTLELGVHYSFRPDMKLTAGVTDVFNKACEQQQVEHDHWGGTTRNMMQNIWFPRQGRTYYATVQYSF